MNIPKTINFEIVFVTSYDATKINRQCCQKVLGKSSQIFEKPKRLRNGPVGRIGRVE